MLPRLFDLPPFHLSWPDKPLEPAPCRSAEPKRAEGGSEAVPKLQEPRRRESDGP